MAEQRFISKAFLLFGGLLIWAAHFMTVYSANAVACARGLAGIRIFGIGLVPITIILVTIIALAAAAYIVVSALSWQGPISGEPHGAPTTAFLRQMTVMVTLFSMIAIVLSAMPSLIVQPCG